MSQEFASKDEEIKYWKERTEELDREFEEFRESSQQIEKELETQLEQADKTVRELKTHNNRLQFENDTLRVSFLLHFCSLIHMHYILL